MVIYSDSTFSNKDEFFIEYDGNLCRCFNLHDFIQMIRQVIFDYHNTRLSLVCRIERRCDDE